MHFRPTAMNLMPSRYSSILAGLTVDEVSYGCGGIKLFGVAELDQAQVGYSVAPDGTSLCHGEGAWRPSWLVVGYETGCGDPFFIDTADLASPVFTAMHGEDKWEPVRIATSFEAFVKCFEELARISQGRSNPVEKKNNPLPDAERERFLRCVAELNEGEIHAEFWDALLEY